MTINNLQNEVLILLSTFNGEKFISQLLESLSRQKEVNISVLVRDDGSTDRTIDFLHNYAGKLKLNVIEGNNIGLDASFKLLMNESKKYDFDYIAFCDQDDIWMPDKLIRAILMIQSSGKSHYASKRLKFSLDIERSTVYPKVEVKATFPNSIFENIAPGCTMVIRRKHFNNLLREGCAEITGRYDHILYLMSSALKENCFDQQARINYRIHSSNAVGIVRLRKHSIKKILTEVRVKSEQLEVIYEKLNVQMDETDLKLCSEILSKRSFASHLRWIWGLPRLRQRCLHDIFLKVFIFFR